MKNIIVPMDFTEVAVNAFKYAYALFPKSNMHVVHTNYGIATSREPFNIKEGRSKDKILKQEIENQICIEIGEKELPSRIQVHVLDGEVVPTIGAYVNENEIDAMVMGTRDKYDFFDRWVGTVSLGLVKTLKIPTYLIPRYAKFKGFEKTVVASDYHLRNRSFIRQLRDWNADYRSYIKFLHVRREEDDRFDEETELILEELFEKGEVSFGFEIDTVYDKDITQSLLASAYNFGADLLIVIPDNQSFLSSLVFKSISKDLVLKSNIPLLFVHPKAATDSEAAESEAATTK